MRWSDGPVGNGDLRYNKGVSILNRHLWYQEKGQAFPPSICSSIGNASGAGRAYFAPALCRVQMAATSVDVGRGQWMTS